ncbi:uncharacterized protein F5Z01DRAFT_150790 [Emericellopsis atlantica]|uniref:Uncharacterized protein n=1 Tax=Emericellopsis atlantica TaxID=2614577 RepID=A0A9P7ZK77_9HYPO|nr:uncharacterized protein F5Z01DRAFT_150790 [Emericellopsis atlantica]KAG9253624.1 hypothetical protein F5Z01DRAFT_150790 [Emericellopsis atlantica]
MEERTMQHLPPHKVNRISVWRDEVAIASEPSPISPTPSAPSMAASSGSGSSSGASSVHTRPRRSLWRRLTRRLSGKGGAAAAKGEGEDAWDHSTRTEMYREENRVQHQQTRDYEYDHAQEPQRSDHDGGLKDRQERLERAARLLGRAD